MVKGVVEWELRNGLRRRGSKPGSCPKMSGKRDRGRGCALSAGKGGEETMSIR